MNRMDFFLRQGAIVARVVVPPRAIERSVAGRRAADVPRGRDCILEIGQKGV